MEGCYFASHNFARISARKARLVMNMIRGKSVDEAFTILKYTNKRAMPLIQKVLKSAVANAQERGDLKADVLFIADARVNAGSSFKRFKPRAMGRANPICRRTSHLIIGVKEE